MVARERSKAVAQAATPHEGHGLAGGGAAQSGRWSQDVMQRLLDLALDIAAAGHDLKNLLTVAQGNLQMATGEMAFVPPELASGMQAIMKASTLLHELMHKSQKPERAYSSDVAAVVQETLLFSRSLWTRIPDLAVTTEVQKMPPAAIPAQDLQRALLNLILNAAHAMPNGGRLQVAMGFDGVMISVTVRDSGSGMDAATLRAIDQPFVEQQAEGLGLGLASCRMLIEQAQGQMQISSVRGVGTSVTLRIPPATDATI